MLAKNYRETMALVSEMLTMPAFKQADFDRIKQAQLTNIKQSLSNPSRTAFNVFSTKLYGDDHPLGIATGGTLTSVDNITLKDVENYYAKNIKPQGSQYHSVGAVDKESVVAALSSFSDWSGATASLPKLKPATTSGDSRVFFIDIPDAKQSVIYMGKLLPNAQNDDIYPIEYANTSLGGGISGRLAQTLRIEKGYTYGAYSYVRGGPYNSAFIASSQVRSNVTKESLEEFKRLVGDYKDTFNEEDLAVMQNMVIKGNARAFETLGSKLRMLEDISEYARPVNYVEKQQEYALNANLSEVHRVIDTYIQEPEMIYVVAGDGATQRKKVKAFSKALNANFVELDIHGNTL